jgi:hypothetical protein
LLKIYFVTQKRHFHQETATHVILLQNKEAVYAFSIQFSNVMVYLNTEFEQVSISVFSIRVTWTQ